MYSDTQVKRYRHKQELIQSQDTTKFCGLGMDDVWMRLDGIVYAFVKLSRSAYYIRSVLHIRCVLAPMTPQNILNYQEEEKISLFTALVFTLIYKAS